jgi:hypothetical protein
MSGQVPFEVGDLVTYDPNGYDIRHLGVGIVYEKQHIPFSVGVRPPGHVIRVLFTAKQCRRVFRDNTDILQRVVRESTEVLKVYGRKQ